MKIKMKNSICAILTLVLFTGLAGISSNSFGANTGSLDDDDPPAKVAPAPKAKVEAKPKTESIKVTPADRKTDATTCEDCKAKIHKDPTLDPIEPKVYSSSQREACYRQHLLGVAKVKVRERYGNRDHSIGGCAKGVRKILQDAGMNFIGALGHAYDFKRNGTMKALGFKDIYYSGMRAEDAPPGAVLVFSGDNTPNYHGRIGAGSAGSWVGHVTIKGDNGFYYTDGRTPRPAIARRYLAAVYVPSDTSRFSAKTRQLCGE